MIITVNIFNSLYQKYNPDYKILTILIPLTKYNW